MQSPLQLCSCFISAYSHRVNQPLFERTTHDQTAHKNIHILYIIWVYTHTYVYWKATSLTLAVGKSGGGSARDNRSVLFLFPQVRIAQAVGLRRGKIRLPEEGGGDQTASVVRRAQGSRLSKKNTLGAAAAGPRAASRATQFFTYNFILQVARL